MTAAPPEDRSDPRIEPLDLAILVALLALAAILRFVSLPSRGQWDADQGTEMLVLDRLIHAGQWPLLGPGVSVLGGTLHHGALFYYVLAPFALVSGADPPITIIPIALAGVATVGLAWWLGRAIGGRWAGAIAGLLAAVSATAIASSTTLWNPNLVPVASLGAICAAWAAWHGRSAWWGVALVAFVAAIQFHLAAVALVIPLGVIFVLDLRRPARNRRAVAVAVGWGALAGIALSLPFIVHELTSGLEELRTLVAGLSGSTGGGQGGGAGTSIGLPDRIVTSLVRVLSWPLSGDLLIAPGAAALAAGGLAAGLVVALRASWTNGRASSRAGLALLGGTLGGLSIVLAIIAPGLATEVPALPVDHYHAFLDPLVFVVGGVVVAGIWRVGAPGRVVAAAALVVLVGWNAAHWPPLVAPDGGWPGAQSAAARIIRAAGTETISFSSIPDFKPADEFIFPVVHAGHEVSGPTAGIGTSRIVAIVCDRRFIAAGSLPCGGPAEDASFTAGAGSAAGAQPGAPPAGLELIDRFAANTDETISVYRRTTP